MAQKRQGTTNESSTGFLETVGLSETSNGKTFRWTIRRRRFCHALVRNGGNLAKASEEAGYASENEGSRLLRFAQVRKYIEIDMRNHLASESVTEESVIARWANWASLDIAEYFEKDTRKGRRYQVRVKEPWKISERARQRIKKFTVKELEGGQELTFEFHDPMKANEKLAILLGLMQPDRDQQGIDADATARDIYETLRAMEELDGLESSSLTADREADPAVDAADQAPGPA